MKERPILFSGPMVRAILDGRKTMTRRLVDMRKYPAFTRPEPMMTNVPGTTVWMNPDDPTGTMVIRRCPFGIPGDRLWVRETWYPAHDSTVHTPKAVYLATVQEGCHPPRWRPSIHMPRWASRITLEVVSVRVERLQDMTEQDAIDEGAMTLPNRASYEAECEARRAAGEIKPPVGDSPLVRFARLWDTINGECAWASNPWVWVREFKVVKPETAGGG